MVFALARILVPTNLGEPSRTAVQRGVELARQFGAKLFVLHVLDARKLDAALETERVLEVLSPDAPERPGGEPSPEEVARNAARHDLERLLTPADEQDVHAEYLLRPSGVAGTAEAIVACARELGVELIVMGKHHLGFVEHMLAGSVAEKVVRHAPCAVLVLQPPAAASVVPETRKATAAH
jgi:nucleotide-binding universal stress UspA family protein